METSASNASLREYYIRLNRLYENAVSLLTAINQSLSTSASEVTVTIVGNDDVTQKVRIPSFLYLENKVEQLGLNFDNLFEMPASGDGWFSKQENLYKFKMLKSTSAPARPEVPNAPEYAQFTDNNVLKDMVSPKTFFRLKLDGIPENINTFVMKKLIINDASTFESLKALTDQSYSGYVEAMYNLKKGVDYTEYDSTISMPIKKDPFVSEFRIVEIPDMESGNPWTEASTGKLRYKLRLDTIRYSSVEDPSISYSLAIGDMICLGDRLCIYKVIYIDTDTETIIIEESVGHTALQTYEENTSMFLQLYRTDYSEFHYLDIPLEENQYLIVFVAAVYDNVRSSFSDAVPINLGAVTMHDAGGNEILDTYGNPLTYMEYYKKYCTNVGDLILGLSETAYNQTSNYTSDQLELLTGSDDLSAIITSSVVPEENIQVVPINKHLTDDATSSEIIALHAQKNTINAKLSTVQSNITDTYNTLLNTDFTHDVTVSQSDLQAQLTEYYSERTLLQTQLNDIVDNINTRASEVMGTDGIKYRIRGVIDPTAFESRVTEIAGERCYVIGLDVEYKYKSNKKSTTNVTTIDDNTFTEWNRLNNIDRQRKLVFSDTGYGVDFVDYSSSTNIIKWNQIDIPITANEDVIIRCRYKYSVGQPFINLYSPWSSNITVTFPTEYSEDVELTTIIEQNVSDTAGAEFSKTLINDGYQEHIQDKTVANNQKFFHSASNIYSGFNTSENNLISLKDKLTQMDTNINKYQSIIEQETNTKFEVYLTFDNEQVLISPNTTNGINIYNTEHIKDMFIRKDINIIIKNTGDTPVNLYSIFPGDAGTRLIKSNMPFYSDTVGNYERVPLYVNNTITSQSLGQWVYFRQNNPFTKKDNYHNSDSQNIQDFIRENRNDELKFIGSPSEYLAVDDSQVLIGYKRHKSIEHSLDYIYKQVGEEYDYISERQSYIDVITKHSNMMEVMSYECSPKDSVTITTHYDSPSSFRYSYTLTGTVVSLSYDSMEIDCSKITCFDSQLSVTSYVTAAQVFANSDPATAYLNTFDSVIIGSGKYADTSADTKWHGTRVEYTLKNPDDITVDITLEDYIKEITDQYLATVPATNENYTGDYLYHREDTDTTNRYLIRYEDICGVIPADRTKKKYMLDSTMSLTKFISNYSVDYFKDVSENTTKFIGAFLFPELLSSSQISAGSNDNSSKTIPVGESVSIPITFEYFVDGDTYQKISKTLCFDIRNSLITDPLHYIITITGNYDYTATGDIFTNIDSI